MATRSLGSMVTTAPDVDPDLEQIIHEQKHLVDGGDPAPTITTEIDYP